MNKRFESFTTYISKINRNIKKIENLEMLDYDLKSYHVSVLFNLYTYNSLTSKELTEKCEEDKGTISRTLKYLEENGFITCPCQNKKRYNSYFYLTDKGEKVGKEIENRFHSFFENIDDCISNEERQNLYEYLSRISDRLEKITNDLIKGE